MRRNYRKPKEARPIHELTRIGATVLCSTCGRIDTTTVAEVNGKPKQEYCPRHLRALIKGEHLEPKKKYGNVPKTVHRNGVKKSFQSTLEANRYEVLLSQQERGEIENLQTQVPFRLDVNGVHICKYYADFTYNLVGQDELVVEDSKGFLTDVFKLKARLFKAIYGSEIVLTRKHELKSRQRKK